MTDTTYKIVRHFGPGCIRKSLDRLASIRGDIGREAGLDMPPVVVHSTGWYAPGNGTIFATVGPRDIGGMIQWCANVPLSTPLLVTDDDVLRRLLCHEFSHVFFWILAVLGTDGAEDPTGLSVQGQLDYARKVDGDRLADPADWFGAADVQNFMANTESDDALAPYVRRFSDVWLGHNLPVRVPPLFYRATGRFGCYRSIAERAKEIKGIDNPSEVLR